MLKRRKFKKLEKAVSLVTVFCFIFTQPLYAISLEEENLTQEEQNQAGFVDATQAEESYQNQLNEVERMQAQLEESQLSDGAQDSILTKFQNTDGQTAATLAETQTDLNQVSQELATQKLNSQVDLAMLKMDLAPEISPIFVEPLPVAPIPVPTPVSEEDSQPTQTEETLLSEQEKIQAVPLAELGFSGTQVIVETSETQTPVLVAEETTSTASTSENTTNSQLAAASVEGWIEEPVSLAGMTDGSTDSTYLGEGSGELAQVSAPVGTSTDSPVAMELASLMNVDTAVSSSSPAPMDVESYSLMGALTPQMEVSGQASNTTLQDPPIVIIPLPAPFVPFTPGNLFPDDFELDPTEEETDQVGGISLFGDILEAIRTMIFADANLAPNGKVIGDGVNDAVTLLTEFMVMFFKFFGFSFTAGELRNLILRGTTEDGMELFGISAGDAPPIVPLLLLFSSFVLATSVFFPQTGREGLDVDDIRSRKADAFKISLPIIIPHALLTSLGNFINTDPNKVLTDAEATTAGRNAVALGILSFLNISLSLMTPTDGKPLKIFDPNGKEPGEFATKETLNLTLPPEAIQFIFSADQAPEASESLKALLQAMNANGTISQTGLFGIITIDLGTIVNQIGDFITRAFTENLGDVLKYYKSLGFETGASANAPSPALPLLLLLGFNFHQLGGTGTPTLNSKGLPFSNQLFFPLMLALPLIFTLSRPPIPDISSPDPNSASNLRIHQVFFQNAGESFEAQAKARKAEEDGKLRGLRIDDKKAKKPAKKAARPGKK